jgi:hypothetical protein
LIYDLYRWVERTPPCLTPCFILKFLLVIKTERNKMKSLTEPVKLGEKPITNSQSNGTFRNH